MQLLQGNNLPRVKASNQSAILRTIYYYGPIQRTEIAERLLLTLPTITTNINQMLANGLLREKSTRETTGVSGRRARLLEINEAAHCFAGVELKGNYWNICITDFCGNTLAVRSGEQRGPDYESVMEQIAREFMHCLSESGKELSEICGTGFCLPGLVDRDHGMLKVNARYQWVNKNVCDDFAGLTGYRGRITLENTAVARGLGAQLFQRDMLEDGASFAYMLVSAGIACPLFLNNAGYRGSVVGAGEAGHMVIEPAGRACTCGDHGCLEAYASEYAVVNDCVREMEQGRAQTLKKMCADEKKPEMVLILKAQAAGDRDVCRIVEDAVHKLAIAVRNIIHFTRPDILLMDGMLFQNEDNRQLLLNHAQSSLYSAAYPGTTISFVRPDRFAGALGAVAVAIDEKLETPV